MAQILIVDDTEIIRRALELAVKKMGHDAESTSSPQVALELARSNPPDLALIDVCMPGMDGPTLFIAMSAALGERCPRVLFVSAVAPDHVTVEKFTHQHRIGYVKKPFLLDDLSRAITEALGGTPSQVS